MKIKRILTNKSITLFWLISYIVIFVFPFIVSLCIYFYGSNIAKEQILYVNDVVSRQVGQSVDKIVGEMRSIANQISLYPSMRVLQESTYPLDNKQLYAAYEISNNLKALKTNAVYVEDFYIYMKNSDYVISARANIRASEYYDTYISHEAYSYMQWKDLLLSGNEQQFTKIVDENNGTVKNSIAYIRPIPIYQKNNYDAVIVVAVREDAILEAAAANEFYNGAFAVLDQDNTKVIEYGEVGNLNDFDLSGRNKRVVQWKDNMLITCMTSEATDWKYITINYKDDVFKSVNVFKVVVVILLAVCLIFGIAVITYCVKRNYAPVQDLMRIVSAETGQKNIKNDEYTYIKEKITKVLEDRRNIVTEYKETLFERYITELLEGNAGFFEEHKDFEEVFKNHFIWSNYSVAAINIENINMLFKDDDISEKEKFSSARLIIENVFQELLEHEARIIVLNNKNLIICLFNWHRKEEYFKIISEAAEKMKYALKKYFALSFSLTAGNIYEGAEYIPISYKEALSAMEYKIVFHKKNMMFYKEIEYGENEHYKYTMEDESRLINGIKAGNAEAASEKIDEIFKNNFENKIISLQMAKCFQFDMVSTVIKVVDDFHNSNNDFKWDERKLESLTKCRSIEEIRVCMKEIITELCGYSKEKGSRQIVKTVQNYVQQHRKDPDLNVNSIAEAINMNPAYLSTVFKEKSGERLLDYIITVKMQYACTLLKDTEQSVEEIAQKVGYAPRTFSRVFKKYYGITPAEYRRGEINFVEENI